MVLPGMDVTVPQAALVRALRAKDSTAAERIALEDSQGGLEALRAAR